MQKKKNCRPHAYTFGCNTHPYLSRNHLFFLSEQLKISVKRVQLNLHENDLLFWYFSYYLTWHCSSISEDLHSNDHNLVTKNNFVIRFVQICTNLQKSWNNMMSNDGLITEYMDLSHIHLAVFENLKFKISEVYKQNWSFPVSI